MSLFIDGKRVSVVCICVGAVGRSMFMNLFRGSGKAERQRSSSYSVVVPDRRAESVQRYDPRWVA